MLSLTFEEYIEHKKDDQMVERSTRLVCYCTELDLESALVELRNYKYAFRKVHCPDGYNGTIVEYRLLQVSQVKHAVKEDILYEFQVPMIKPGMADTFLKDHKQC